MHFIALVFPFFGLEGIINLFTRTLGKKKHHIRLYEWEMNGNILYVYYLASKSLIFSLEYHNGLNVKDGNIYARTKARLWLCSRKVFPNSLSLCNLKKTRFSVAFLWLFWGWDDPQVLQNLITEGKRNAYCTWINSVSLSADTGISRAFHPALERIPKWREMVGRRPEKSEND